MVPGGQGLWSEPGRNEHGRMRVRRVWAAPEGGRKGRVCKTPLAKIPPRFSRAVAPGPPTHTSHTCRPHQSPWRTQRRHPGSWPCPTQPVPRGPTSPPFQEEEAFCSGTGLGTTGVQMVLLGLWGSCRDPSCSQSPLLHSRRPSRVPSPTCSACSLGPLSL